MNYLGIDWGLKRIGLAISFGELAAPLSTLEVKNLEDAISKISQITKQEEIDVLVLGKPEGKMGEIVDNAVKKLQKIGYEVRVADETLSTKQAMGKMIELGVSQKKRKDDNQFSAAYILQNYLDNKARFTNKRSK